MQLSHTCRETPDWKYNNRASHASTARSLYDNWHDPKVLSIKGNFLPKTFFGKLDLIYKLIVCGVFHSHNDLELHTAMYRCSKCDIRYQAFWSESKKSLTGHEIPVGSMFQRIKKIWNA